MALTMRRRELDEFRIHGNNDANDETRFADLVTAFNDRGGGRVIITGTLKLTTQHTFTKPGSIEGRSGGQIFFSSNGTIEVGNGATPYGLGSGINATSGKSEVFVTDTPIGIVQGDYVVLYADNEIAEPYTYHSDGPPIVTGHPLELHRVSRPVRIAAGGYSTTAFRVAGFIWDELTSGMKVYVLSDMIDGFVVKNLTCTSDDPAKATNWAFNRIARLRIENLNMKTPAGGQMRFQLCHDTTVEGSAFEEKVDPDDAAQEVKGYGIVSQANTVFNISDCYFGFQRHGFTTGNIGGTPANTRYGSTRDCRLSNNVIHQSATFTDDTTAESVECIDTHAEGINIEICNSTFVVGEENSPAVSMCPCQSRSRNTIVRNNTFTSASGSNIGVQIFASDAIIEGNHFQNFLYGVWKRTYSEGGTTGYGDNLKATNNTFINCVSSGIELDFGDNHLISNNTFVNCGSNGSTHPIIGISAGTGHRIVGNEMAKESNEFSVRIDGTATSASIEEFSGNTLNGYSGSLGFDRSTNDGRLLDATYRSRNIVIDRNVLHLTSAHSLTLPQNLFAPIKDDGSLLNDVTDTMFRGLLSGIDGNDLELACCQQQFLLPKTRLNGAFTYASDTGDIYLYWDATALDGDSYTGAYVATKPGDSHADLGAILKVSDEFTNELVCEMIDPMIATGGMSDPTTTQGDLIVRNATMLTRLPVGATDGHVLKVNSGAAEGMSWAAESDGLPITTHDPADISYDATSLGSSMNGTVNVSANTDHEFFGTLAESAAVTLNVNDMVDGESITIWIRGGAGDPTVTPGNFSWGGRLADPNPWPNDSVYTRIDFYRFNTSITAYYHAPRQVIKNNLNATSDPTGSDDSTADYYHGSKWINTTTDKEFVLVDIDVPGSAVWKETTGTGGGGGDVTAVPTPADDQLAIWTGASTIEGDANLTWDGSALDITGQVRETGPIAVVSATQLGIGSSGNYYTVSGTTTISSIADVGVGTEITLHFQAALQLTNTSSLDLPFDITTGAGDHAIFRQISSTEWRLIQYQRADGSVLSGLSDPTTLKGDLLVRDASSVTRLPVGTDNQILVADANETTGVKWATQSTVSTGYDLATDFGAVGDGNNDDTVPLQNAINNSTSPVFIPAGTYRLTSTVTVPANKIVYGAGKNTVLKGEQSDGTAIVKEEALGDYVVIKTLQIEGTGAAVNVTGLELQGANRCVLEDVYITACGVGAKVGDIAAESSPDGVWIPDIRNLFVKNCGTIGVDVRWCNGGFFDVNIENDYGQTTGQYFRIRNAQGTWFRIVAEGETQTVTSDIDRSQSLHFGALYMEYGTPGQAGFETVPMVTVGRTGGCSNITIDGAHLASANKHEVPVLRLDNVDGGRIVGRSYSNERLAPVSSHATQVTNFDVSGFTDDSPGIGTRRYAAPATADKLPLANYWPDPFHDLAMPSVGTAVGQIQNSGALPTSEAGTVLPGHSRSIKLTDGGGGNATGSALWRANFDGPMRVLDGEYVTIAVYIYAPSTYYDPAITTKFPYVHLEKTGSQLISNSPNRMQRINDEWGILTATSTEPVTKANELWVRVYLQNDATNLTVAGQHVFVGGILAFRASNGDRSALAKVARGDWHRADEHMPFYGTDAPTENNDSDTGHFVGKRWIDTTNEAEYVCLDDTSGAAVWTETTGAGSGEANIQKATYIPADPNPDVTGKTYIEITNAAPTDILNFVGGVEGQVLNVALPSAVNVTTIKNNTNIKLAGATDFEPLSSTNAAIQLTYDGLNWIESGRSLNSHTLSVAEDAGDLELINTNNAAIHMAIDNPQVRVASFGGTGLQIPSGRDLTLTEQADNATTPTASQGVLWAKTDGSLQYTTDAGDTDLTAGALAALSDTTITTPSNGEHLVYNGTVWVNQADGGGDVTAGGTPADNQIAVWTAVANEIEGANTLTYNGTTLEITGGLTTTTTVAATGNVTGANLSGTNTGDNVTATTSAEGIAELATQAEVDAGIAAQHIVTPATLNSWPGSTAITTLGAVATGTWSANISGATLTGALDVGTNQLITSTGGTNDIELDSSRDIVMQLGDAAGVNEWRVEDSAAMEVAAIDSDGNLTTDGTIIAQGEIAVGDLAESSSYATSGTITPNPDDGLVHEIGTLSGNLVIAATNTTSGKPMLLWITQHATLGPYTVDVSNATWFDTGATGAKTPAAGKVARVQLEKHGTTVHAFYLEEG